jgi:hypothetical protein
VIHQRVPCGRNVEGGTLRVLCGGFDAASGLCRRQTHAHANGWLGEFLERANDQTRSVRGARCRLAGAATSRGL